MATVEQIAIVRSWVGTAADLSDLDDRLIRLTTPEAAALEILRTQLADFLAAPTKLDVDGDVAADWTANLAHLRTTIKTLEAIVAGQGGAAASDSVSVASLSRPGRRR